MSQEIIVTAMTDEAVKAFDAFGMSWFKAIGVEQRARKLTLDTRRTETIKAATYFKNNLKHLVADETLEGSEPKTLARDAARIMVAGFAGQGCTKGSIKQYSSETATIFRAAIKHKDALARMRKHAGFYDVLQCARTINRAGKAKAASSAKSKPFKFDVRGFKAQSFDVQIGILDSIIASLAEFGVANIEAVADTVRKLHPYEPTLSGARAQAKELAQRKVEARNNVVALLKVRDAIEKQQAA